MYRKNRIFHFLLSVLLCLCMFFVIRALFLYWDIFKEAGLYKLQEQVISLQSPALAYMNQNASTKSTADIGKEMIKEILPIYGYSDGYPNTALQFEDTEMIEQIILSEGRDGHDGPGVTATETQKEPSVSLNETLEARQEANQGMGGQVAGDKEAGEEQIASEAEGVQGESSFSLNETPVADVNLEELKDFETLLSKYYVLDGTYISEEQLNVTKLLERDMSLKGGNDKPQILLYHTHSQEAFADSDPADKSTTIVGAGEKLTNLLRGYGYNVIHHTGEYDVDGRDYAYSLAAPAIEEILASNPSIEVIIDLHRDGVLEGTHLVTEINGKKMAQFMFFNGLSRTKTKGEIDYLKNENIDENLAFSFRAQLMANKYYPNLARKIYLKGYRYNMHYRGKTLLIELGAQTNTVEEIMNAIDPIAHIIKLTLDGEKTE